MSLLFLICTVCFCMVLGSFFPNHGRTHLPPNSPNYNNAFYQPQQPNPYYQQPFTPPTHHAYSPASPLLYTIIFMVLLMAFMRFMV